MSDIHLQSGGPLIVGHHGRMIRCSPFTLDHPTLLYLTDQIFSPDIKALIQRGTGADRSLQLEGNSDSRFGLQRGERLRFRANFTQATIRGLSTAAAVTLRIINNHIPDLSDMGLPEDLFRALAALPHEGIGLICGPTGSGKSTLLTATYQHHGRTSPHCKIVTYEDPVEAL
ncbi:Flp pilus assembly complex ATPase component, partial [Escherichia coli]|nr:Flp pilus assembly complex ATPase component [Escherichia coli]